MCAMPLNVFTPHHRFGNKQGRLQQEEEEVRRAVLQEWDYLKELRPQISKGARRLLHDQVCICADGWVK